MAFTDLLEGNARYSASFAEKGVPAGPPGEWAW